MSKDLEKDIEKKLEAAYDNMLAFVKKTLSEVEEKSEPLFKNAIEKAKDAEIERLKALLKQKSQN